MNAAAARPAPPAGAPATRITLISRSTVVLMLGAGVLCLVLGSYLLWRILAGATVDLLDGVEQVIAIVVSAGFAVLGLLLVVILALARGDTLVVDDHGIRRTGVTVWELPWDQVRTVGLTVRHRIRATRLPPVTRPVLQRRRVLLLLELLPDSGAGDRKSLRHMRRTRLDRPFTHAERLPDTTPFAPRPRIVADLDEALARHAPHLHAGVRSE